MTLVGNGVEADRHAFALKDGAARLLAHLSGFQAAVAALGRVQPGQNAGQIGIGLQ